jgi:hypothetical protein
MKFRFYSFAIVSALSAAMIGCGGSDGGSPAGAPPAQAQINSSNYLDAFWVGGVAVARIVNVADAIDAAFETVIDANDDPGTYNCVAGGTITFAKTGNVRTLTVNNCSDGVAIYVSGSMTSSNAVAGTFGNLTLLLSGDFQITNVVYRFVGGDGVNETVNGNVNVQRRNNLSVAGAGAFSVARNGRTDQYTAISITTSVPDANGDVDIESGTLTISSPRFPHTLTLAGTTTALTLTAPDGSLVRGTDATVANVDALRYDVLTSSTAQPTLTQTYVLTDGLVLAAIARALL